MIMAQGAVAAMQIYQGDQEQKEGMRYQEEVMARTQKSAQESAGRQYASLARRADQTRKSAQSAMRNAALQADRASAVARVQSADRGGAGSLEDVLQSVAIQSAEYQATLATQLDWDQAAILDQFDAIQAQQQNRINAAQGGPVAGPNYVAILGDLASSAADAAYEKWWTPSPKAQGNPGKTKK